ncbi:MAG: ABC transporter ATP-binding protein, partial [Yaniella sp.]|nr:ABC transporter ATP-binding protein [Yaniella sp.]
MTIDHRLTAYDLQLGYGDHTVIDQLDFEVLHGNNTCIVGANASGKSTLLKSMSRVLKPQAGQVLLDGHAVHHMPAKRLAQILGLLPQTPIAPEGITVVDLVGRGRHPHQGVLSRWTHSDDEVVANALDATNTAALADRAVDELSGG